MQQYTTLWPKQGSLSPSDALGESENIYQPYLRILRVHIKGVWCEQDPIRLLPLTDKHLDWIGSELWCVIDVNDSDPNGSHVRRVLGFICTGK